MIILGVKNDRLLTDTSFGIFLREPSKDDHALACPSCAMYAATNLNAMLEMYK